MKKRCIWNWDKKKKIECLDEKRKRSRFFVVLSFWGGIVIEIGIPIIILIVLLLDAIINVSDEYDYVHDLQGTSN